MMSSLLANLSLILSALTAPQITAQRDVVIFSNATELRRLKPLKPSAMFTEGHDGNWCRKHSHCEAEISDPMQKDGCDQWRCDRSVDSQTGYANFDYVCGTATKPKCSLRECQKLCSLHASKWNNCTHFAFGREEDHYSATVDHDCILFANCIDGQHDPHFNGYRFISEAEKPYAENWCAEDDQSWEAWDTEHEFWNNEEHHFGDWTIEEEKMSHWVGEVDYWINPSPHDMHDWNHKDHYIDTGSIGLPQMALCNMSSHCQQR